MEFGLVFFLGWLVAVVLVIVLTNEPSKKGERVICFLPLDMYLETVPQLRSERLFVRDDKTYRRYIAAESGMRFDVYTSNGIGQMSSHAEIIIIDEEGGEYKIVYENDRLVFTCLRAPGEEYWSFASFALDYRGRERELELARALIRQIRQKSES